MALRIVKNVNCFHETHKEVWLLQNFEEHFKLILGLFELFGSASGQSHASFAAFSRWRPKNSLKKSRLFYMVASFGNISHVLLKIFLQVFEFLAIPPVSLSNYLR